MFISVRRCCIVIVVFVLCRQVMWAGPPPAGKSDVLLTAMQNELQRAQNALSKREPAPYFTSYSVYDQELSLSAAMLGSVVTSTATRARQADVVMRVGSVALDNTHENNRFSALTTGLLPLEDDPDALARALWRLTYSGYRKSSRAFLNVKTKTQVSAKEEDTSPDFSNDKPQVNVPRQVAARAVDQQALDALTKRISAYFRQFPHVYESVAVLMREKSRRYFVSTEGSRLVTDSSVIRLMVQAETRADDGMALMRVETFQAESLDQLPSEAEINARLQKMAADLEKLRTATVAEPFDGPALLSARAAAVFFHEVLGHRLEGQRQRGEQEGKTFTKMVNQSVLPSFLSVTDDPTVHLLAGNELAGHYEYDEEGVPAQRVELVKDGILKNFLMSRLPIANFEQSNGHGRAQAGLMATGRQGNLIVTSTNMVKEPELRQKFIEEIKKQGKPYGLYFEDIEGGFTLTQRSLPQAFQVLPVLVWRVYPDGRPDELVRGVDIVGTPLAALTRILLTGDKLEAFNGVCGAESGQVPVSAVAPAMLFSEIEVQKRAHSLERPPILPPPVTELANTAKPATAGGAQ